MKALIIVDAQNDFMPGGSLQVKDGDKIVPVINSIQQSFDLIAATQDWHPPHHSSFASNWPGKQPFEQVTHKGLSQTLWPDHCIQNATGAEFHPELHTAAIEAIFRKGLDPDLDSYSGFYDNGHHKSTGLAGYLKEKQVDQLFFCGLCADICVYYTLLDAITEGFDCTLIEDGTKPIDQQAYENIKIELANKGVRFISSHDI